MNHLLDKNKYTKDSEPSPFSELNGPFYTQVVNNKIYKGFEVAKKNCNKAMIAHGGILVAFADSVMGYTAWEKNQLPCLTAKINGNYRLVDCDMFVTLEPCLMCLGAIFNARINSLFFGAYDKKTGVCESVLSLANNKLLNHHCSVQGGILEEESKALLQKFFREKRQKKTTTN